MSIKHGLYEPTQSLQEVLSDVGEPHLALKYAKYTITGAVYSMVSI